MAVCLAFVTGCAAAKGQIVEFVGNDITTTRDMALKYNKPQVAKCADFMLVQIDKLGAANTQLEALRNEPTNGLLSMSLKAALVADALRSLEQANGPQVKAEFKAACSEVAGDIVFNVMQDAAKIGKR